MQASQTQVFSMQKGLAADSRQLRRMLENAQRNRRMLSGATLSLGLPGARANQSPNLSQDKN